MIDDDLKIHFINVAPIKLFDSVNFASDKLRNREEVVVGDSYYFVHSNKRK